MFAGLVGLNQKHLTQHKCVSNPSLTLLIAMISLLRETRKTTSIPSLARRDLMAMRQTLSEHILLLIGIGGAPLRKVLSEYCTDHVILL